MIDLGNSDDRFHETMVIDSTIRRWSFSWRYADRLCDI